MNRNSLAVVLLSITLISVCIWSCNRKFNVAPSNNSEPTTCSGVFSGNTVISCGQPLPCDISGDLEITCSSYTDLSVINDVSGNITTCVAPVKMPKTYSGNLTVDPSICK